jgi:hypothetical protein
MAKAVRFDSAIFFRALAGTAVGTALGVALLLWVVPGAGNDYRPAVLSTIVVPLGCFAGWLLSGSRERAGTAALVCFGLYFLSAFAAARLGTLVESFKYFPTVVGVQSLGAVGLAVLLGFLGRGLPQVERLRDARDVAGLAALLHDGAPRERWEAARALGAVGGEASRPALLAALDDTDPAVRRAALAGLVGLARPEDRPRLEGFRTHPDRRTQHLAREVLHWIE